MGKMTIFDPNKMSWITRLRLCWTVLTKGVYNKNMYKTRYMQRQWDICRERDKEMQKGCRPRTNYNDDSEFMEQ